MSSRSNWLKHTRDYNKQNLYGRKYFNIHKNQHNLEIFKDDKISLSPLHGVTDHIRQVGSLSSSPANLRVSKSPTFMQVKDNHLSQQLKQKDSELKLLRQLYNETSKKLKNVVQYRYIEDNLKTLNTSEIIRASRNTTIAENRSVKKFSGKAHLFPELNNKSRNMSSPNYKVDINIDTGLHPVFRQPKYTKNRPKIIFGNPITGIPCQMISKNINL